MSEWVMRCADDLQSGVYYASVDIHDGEQPILLLFKKEENKTIIVGHGELVSTQPHGRLGDLDALRAEFPEPSEKNGGWRNPDEAIVHKTGIWAVIDSAPTIIAASEEAYATGYDTAGNYHWTGTRTWEHIVPAENGEV